MKDHCTLDPNSFVLMIIGKSIVNIFYFYFTLNQVYVVSAQKKNQQNCLKFACGQSEIESEVCVIAS